MDPVAVIEPVGGTWSYDGDVSPDEWYHPRSALFQYFAGHGLTHASPDEPFVWDGEVDGVGWPRWSRTRLVWFAAADHLAYRLRRMALKDRNLLAHSHGGQIATRAANLVPINRLVTVAMPVRDDMRDYYRGVRAAEGWWHVAHLGLIGDRMQLLGAMLDGSLGVERRVLEPGVQNVLLPGVGHSGLLRDPALFHHWLDSGLVPFLRGRHA